jgi:hypothetical protein
MAPVQAATGINKQINYQGRLLTRGGGVVADGTYNVRFRVYQDGDGVLGGGDEVLKWTEEYKNSSSQGVVVKNGYFSVALATYCPLDGSACTGQSQTNSAIDFNQSALWLSMDVGGTGSGAITYDGELTPFKRLTSAVYAFQSADANKLNGLTSGQFVQLAPAAVQVDSTTNASIFLNKTAAGNLMTLQKGGVDAFDVDNTGNLLFGNNADKTVQIAQAAASTAGNKLTVAAGQGGTGTGSVGGKLVLHGGAAGGTNANGGDVLVYGGAKTGAGTNGNVSLAFDGTSAVGTVGIGKAASSSFALDVNGAINSSGTISATTSVTAPQFSSSGAVTVQSGGSGDLTLTTASGTLVTNASTIQRTAAGTTNLDLKDGSNTTLAITNSGAGVANLTLDATAAIAGANALTLGTTGTNTGAVLFKGSTAASGVLTLQGPNNPTTATLSIPAITASANVCTDNSLCAGYQAPPASGSFVQTIPTTTPQNTISPATASIVALTVNATSSTAAQALVVNQAGGADAGSINVTGSSQTNGLVITRTNAGTLTNALAITNTSGTVTNGLVFSGTIGTDILRGSGTLTIQGTSGITLTAGGTTTLAADTGGAGTVNIGSTNAMAINLGGLAPAVSARTTTIAGGNSGVVDTVNIATGNTTVAGGKTVHIADGTPTGSGTNLVTIGSLANASSTTIQGGSGNVNLITSQAGTGTIVKTQTNNSTTAFQIQNAAGTSFFTADSVNKINNTQDLNVGSATNMGGAQRLFSDGFEGGSTSIWTAFVAPTVTLDTATVRNGKYAAKMNVSNAQSEMEALINGATTTVMRAYVNVTSQSTNNLDMLTLYGSGSSSFIVYREATTGRVGIWNNVAGASNTGTNTVMSASSWHKVELVAVIGSGTSGSLTAYLDDVAVVTWTGINTSTNLPNHAMIGDGNTNRTGVEYIDDVAVDTVRPGDSASLNVADSLHVSGTASLGQTWVQPGTDSTQIFQILNTAGAAVVNADTINNKVSLASGNTGEISGWSSSSNLIGGYGAASVTLNGYVYFIGGKDAGGSFTAAVNYAKLNADGSNGVWSTTTVLPADRWQTVAVAYNGYIYLVAGNTDGAGTDLASIIYAKQNPDGTLGAWNSTTSLPVNRRNHAAVVVNGYMYVIGGQQDATAGVGTTYFAKLNHDGTISSGGWATTGALPGAVTRSGTQAVVANGAIYYLGGADASNVKQSTVYWTKPTSSGTVAWNTTQAMPGPMWSVVPQVVNGYVYVFGGNNGTTWVTTVYYAKINADNTISASAWKTSAYSTLLAEDSFGAVTANGYIYMIAGFVNGSGAQTALSYTSTARVSVGGSLDLVGLQGQTLADPGNLGVGSTGGAVTAGNGLFVGALQVMGQATFANAVAVNGSLMAASDLTVGNGFSTTDTTQTNAQLDSTTTFTEAANTCTTTVNGGALYYNSAQTGTTQGGSSAIRACINGAWEDLASTAGLGLMLFGVVPDSGPTAGDQIGTTSYANSACKVRWASTTSVNIANCIAYSGGRKVVLSGLSALTAFSAASSWYHICLNGTNNAPAKTTANASQTANLPAFSAGSPVLCIADVQTGAGSTITNIYDTRVFTTSTKRFATINSATTPGMVVRYNSAGTGGTVEPVAVAGSTVVAGVVAATTGTASANTINGIIVTSGFTFVKALATATFANTAGTSATAGYIANTTTANAMLGTVMRTPDTTCTAATNCQFSAPVEVNLH